MSDDLVKGDLEGIELGRTGGRDSDECCGCLAIVGREINALRQSTATIKGRGWSGTRGSFTCDRCFLHVRR